MLLHEVAKIISLSSAMSTSIGLFKYNISESHNYNSRSSTHGDIKLANPSNNQLMRTFKYNGAKLWNVLAISVIEKPSLDSFKDALDNF